MRKKLVILGFALAAAAASTLTSSADPSIGGTCPQGSHLFVCPTYSFCCGNTAFCACICPSNEHIVSCPTGPICCPNGIMCDCP